MAKADYYLCDVCGCKTFYDADVDYEDYDTGQINTHPHTGHPWPCFVGWMIVLCPDCAKTHTVTVVPNQPNDKEEKR